MVAYCPTGAFVEVPAGSVYPTMENLLAINQDKALHLLGHLKPIELVEIGDLVMGPDGNFQEVLEVFQQARTVDLRVIRVRHRAITVAMDAPMLCEEGVIPAGELSPSDWKSGHWPAIRCGSKRPQEANGIALGQWIATRRIDSVEVIPQFRPQMFYGLRCGPLNFFEANGFYLGAQT